MEQIKSVLNVIILVRLALEEIQIQIVLIAKFFIRGSLIKLNSLFNLIN